MQVALCLGLTKHAPLNMFSEPEFAKANVELTTKSCYDSSGVHVWRGFVQESFQKCAVFPLDTPASPCGVEFIAIEATFLQQSEHSESGDQDGLTRGLKLLARDQRRRGTSFCRHFFKFVDVGQSECTSAGRGQPRDRCARSKKTSRFSSESLPSLGR